MGWDLDDPTISDVEKEDVYQEREDDRYDHPKTEFIRKITKRAEHHRALNNKAPRL